MSELDMENIEYSINRIGAMQKQLKEKIDEGCEARTLQYYIDDIVFEARQLLSLYDLHCCWNDTNCLERRKLELEMNREYLESEVDE